MNQTDVSDSADGNAGGGGGGAWFNAVILNIHKDEGLGVLYRVRLRGDGHQPEIDRVRYESIRQKPRAEYAKGDFVEVAVVGRRGDVTSRSPYFPAKVIHVVTDSSIEGGLAYTVVYWDSGRVPDAFPGDGIVDTAAPQSVRNRFQAGDLAEYYRDDEGWLSCVVQDRLGDGGYAVSVEDGVKQIVNCTADFLRVQLRLGEYAKRKSDGCPVTVMKCLSQPNQQQQAHGVGVGGGGGGDGDDVFIVDANEEGLVRRLRLKRRDIGQISQAELRKLGIINPPPQTSTKFRDHCRLIDRMEDFVEEHGIGPYVWSCHDINRLTGTTVRHTHGLTALAFTHDGEFFATADTHGRVELRHADTGARVAEDSRGAFSEQDLRCLLYTSPSPRDRG